MGFIGFFVNLIFIPINNIIVGVWLDLQADFIISRSYQSFTSSSSLDGQLCFFYSSSGIRESDHLILSSRSSSRQLSSTILSSHSLM
ncbi:hypothetical protein LINGRAHAP2_LOCUS24477 [Linum grandiflorum]